jgi:branched-chain amino acid transport system substrate-binding protein
MTTNRLSRRTLVKAGLSALAAPAALRVIPANAQSRVIKIGHVSPRTGPLAGFGEADPYILEQIQKVLEPGIQSGGRTYKVQIISKDSQSNGSRAAEVASELILRDKVDLIVAASTPDTTNPVADQAEANEVPCVTTDCPWQPYFFGRKGDPQKGFTWTYHFFWGLEDVIAAFLALWDSAPTNKVVGGLFPNDADGNAWGDTQRGLPPALAKAGYKLTDPGRYQVMNNDFTAQISAFKQVGAEIVTGNMIPPDFATFWSQAAQQGFRPKIVTIGKALLFPSVIESLGARGNGLTTEIWWTPNHPFKSGLTGQSAAELTDGYVKATRRPWTQHRGDRLQVDRRPSEVGGPAGEERHQDAVGGGPVAAQGRAVRAHHHHQQAGARDPGRRHAAAAVVRAPAADR